MSFTTLNKTFEILDIFLTHDAPLAAKELIQLTGLPRSGLYKYLATLKKHGYLEYSDENCTYQLGFKFLEFGRKVRQQCSIYEVALPYMEKLHNQVKHVVVLSALSGDRAYCMGRVGKATHDFVYIMEQGVSMPLHCGATSLVLLAHLDDDGVHDFIQNNELKKYTDNTLVEAEELWQAVRRIRKEGYWYSDSEIGIGRAIAAPIFNSSRQILAAISIIGPVFAITDDKIADYIDMVKDYANTITKHYCQLLQ